MSRLGISWCPRVARLSSPTLGWPHRSIKPSQQSAPLPEPPCGCPQRSFSSNPRPPRYSYTPRSLYCLLQIDFFRFIRKKKKKKKRLISGPWASLPLSWQREFHQSTTCTPCRCCSPCQMTHRLSSREISRPSSRTLSRSVSTRIPSIAPPLPSFSPTLLHW